MPAPGQPLPQLIQACLGTGLADEGEQDHQHVVVERQDRVGGSSDVVGDLYQGLQAGQAGAIPEEPDHREGLTMTRGVAGFPLDPSFQIELFGMELRHEK